MTLKKVSPTQLALQEKLLAKANSTLQVGQIFVYGEYICRVSHFRADKNDQSLYVH